MIKKTVVYEDFNGVLQTEELYFNLSRVEVTEMEVSVDGGLSKALEQVAEKKNPADLMKVMKSIIIKAYGVKSADGKRFIKSEQLTEEFASSLAFDELYVSLFTNPADVEPFIRGILPKAPTGAPIVG